MPDILFKLTQIRVMGLFSDIVDEINDWLDGLIPDLVSDIISTILEAMAEKTIEFYTSILEYQNSMLTEDFWESSIVNAFLDFATFCAFGLFVASIIFLISDIVQETACGKNVSGYNVFKGFIFGFMFASFSQSLPIYFCQKVLYILSTVTFSNDIDVSWHEMPNTTNNAVGIIIYVIMLIVLLIATIVFMGVFLSRQAAMLVHIMSAMFYVPEVTRGDTQKIGEWLRQLVALLATTFFQYLFFFGGSSMVLASPILTSTEFYAGLALIFGTFSVPKVLNNFGYSVGNRDVLSTVQGYASSGYYIKALIKR